MKTQALKFKRPIAAPPAQVYRAFTNGMTLREWFCDVAQVDARPGGRVYWAWHNGYYAAGEILKLDPDQRLVFSWHGRGEPEPTQVTVSIAAKDAQSVVTLTHGGVGTGKKWARTLEQFERGWQLGLDNLQAALETGEDQRLTLRPLLGVSGLEDLTPESAAQLGVPVKRGLRLNGVVPGLGAEAAGLQRDDVIVVFAGQKIAAWEHLAAALQRHRAGDRVSLTLYRGPIKHTLTLELSRRPIPAIPPTAAELAAAVRAIYDGVDELLAACFAGVSDAEAMRPPAPDRWSAGETLAHLLISERDTHAWIAEILTDSERCYDHFPPNNLARLRATLTAFPTVTSLLEELKRHEVETVALLAQLPPAFMAHKGSYWRLAYNLLHTVDHTHDHEAQIRAALAAARSPASAPA
jgi:uncharacterized protein YndB with AHSA1/START domain